MGDTALEVTFHGVRGSTACHGHTTKRYGGNTSCVSMRFGDASPIIFDLGTGLRYLTSESGVQPFVGSCLLTHLHWDHTQGLPFLPALLHRDTVLDIYAPKQQDGCSLRDTFATKICPPTFPVGLDEFGATINFHEIGDDEFSIGKAQVMSRFVPHRGPTLGFRVTVEDVTVTYLPDHQQPLGEFSLAKGARQICQDTHLLIHDSQFTPAEFAEKSNWGHSTIEYAMWVAETTSAKCLALFHHDPSRTDDDLDAITSRLVGVARNRGFDVFAAADEMSVQVSHVVSML